MWEALVYYIHPLLHISLFLNHIQLNECKLAIELNRAWKMEQTEQKQNRCIVFSQSKQLVFYATTLCFDTKTVEQNIAN